MATRADMMLMQALTQLGAGFGAHMGRRRQTKQDEEFFNQRYPMTTPEQFQDSPDAQLIGALTGAGLGMAGVRGTGMGGVANQQVAGAQSAQANQQSELMRSLMKDPRAAAMMKQGMIQQQLAASMPQETKITSVSDGYVIQKGDAVNFVKSKGSVEKPGERYETWTVGDKTVVVDLLDKDENGIPKTIMEGQKDKIDVVRRGAGKGPNGESLMIQTVLENGKPVRDLGTPFVAGESNVREMSPGEQKSRREKLTEVRDTLRDYQNIRELFKPEYLTMLGRGTTYFQQGMDALGALDAAPEFFGKKRFTDVKEFYAATQERANKYIKMITGAQMSEAEAGRLMKAIPSIEDSPNTFQAKLDYIVEVSRKSYEAYQFEISAGASLEEAKAAGDEVVKQMLPSGVSVERAMSGAFEAEEAAPGAAPAPGAGIPSEWREVP